LYIAVYLTVRAQSPPISRRTKRRADGTLATSAGSGLTPKAQEIDDDADDNTQDSEGDDSRLVVPPHRLSRVDGRSEETVCMSASRDEERPEKCQDSDVHPKSSGRVRLANAGSEESEHEFSFRYGDAHPGRQCSNEQRSTDTYFDALNIGPPNKHRKNEEAKPHRNLIGKV